MSNTVITYGRRITSEVYYEGQVSSSSEQIEESMFTSKQQILKDVIDALAVISSGETRKLELELQVDSKGRYKLTKRWAV